MRRGLQLSDVVFGLFLAAYAVVSYSRLPYDFRDLCYLFSLEQQRWVIQEWVHPIWIPTLRVLQEALALAGYRGPMLMPVEMFNILTAISAFIVLYVLARRFPGSGPAAAILLAVTALASGFWSAAVRPTPYAMTLLCQALALSVLISGTPLSRRRCAASGALGGLAMGFHASAMALGVVAIACALSEPDGRGAWRDARRRIAAFALGMATVAAACWIVFFLYNGIGADYFRHQRFYDTLLGVEQTPRTSIYTNGSAAEQWRTFVGTFRDQAGALFGAPIALLGLLAVGLRAVRRQSLSLGERQLLVAALANFAAFVAFFVINGTRNGFIFASLTLVPVALAVALRGSWLAVAALLLLAPATVEQTRVALQQDNNGDRDPILGEVRFLQTTLQPTDVVLTPGSPFPEMFYLSHPNIFEVGVGQPTHDGSEVPLLQPGAHLRARVAWWRGRGSRVLYALGDDSSDFSGDVSGAEKDRQIFWRPEADAAARRAALQQVQQAVQAAGLTLRDGPTSPRGMRYAEVGLADPSAPPPAAPATRAPLTPSAVGAATGDQVIQARAAFLAHYAAVLGDDPWLACDVMRLSCAVSAQDGQLPCAAIAGCDPLPAEQLAQAAEQRDQRRSHADAGGHAGCFWGPGGDRQAIGAYLADWAHQRGLGDLTDWGFNADGAKGELVLSAAGATLRLRWKLSPRCTPTHIESEASAGSPPDAQAIESLLRDLPAPKQATGT